jgi:uncharacterized protein with HEPN domain
MRSDDKIRLRHMLDAAREAMGFAEGRKRADLESDRMLVLSIVKDIEIIGEAAYQTSEEARKQLPDISWDDIIGVRHRLVHAYFDINLDILWRTVQDDLPQLSAVLERIVAAISAKDTRE